MSDAPTLPVVSTIDRLHAFAATLDRKSALTIRERDDLGRLLAALDKDRPRERYEWWLCEALQIVYDHPNWALAVHHASIVYWMKRAAEHGEGLDMVSPKDRKSYLQRWADL